MNGEFETEKEPELVEGDEEAGVTSEDISDQTIVIETDDDEVSVLDSSAEIRVDELVAKLDSSSSGDVEKQRKIKKRLEKLEREIGDDLGGTYNIDLDD